eukprot:8061716-Pyramimonas_sp.AAC.2
MSDPSGHVNGFCETETFSDVSTVKTSAVTVLASAHGRQRRLKRKINIRDLQAAVKYGTKEAGYPCPRTGDLRWKYTFADVCYITDETSRREITSWPVPGAGLDVPKVQVYNPSNRSNVQLTVLSAVLQAVCGNNKILR